MSSGAVAIDLGATSGRFAAGRLVDGSIEYEVIEQVLNKPIERDGHVYWNIDELFDLCQRAWTYAEDNFDEATVGIDSWGVDHGFVHPHGAIANPVAYRDLSHQAMFEAMASHRDRLYELTGIQHQPFNTIYQLAARKREGMQPSRWLLMPDLLGYLLTGTVHCEFTMASTTQLMGLDDQWCAEAFGLAGWPLPDTPISKPGHVLERRGGVSLVSVGSHDTASAVFGLGPLRDDQAFLNVGTWSLLGTILDKPLLRSPSFTNERTVDGRVRYLANIPGFYVINRVHEELGIKESVPEWLRSAELRGCSSVDLTSPEFFNPTSMCEALAQGSHVDNWASLALNSLVQTTARQLAVLEDLTKRTFTEIRVSGGGSRSEAFCQALANKTGKLVVAGPEEATLLGNLAVQFIASGHFANFDEASAAIARSFSTRTFTPEIG